MSVRKEIAPHGGIYFATFTVFNWMPLFQELNAYNIVYNFFEVIKSKGNQVNAFVIMPNHVHLIFSMLQEKQSINKMFGNGKRFMAYHLIEILKQQQRLETLRLMADAVSKSDGKKGKLHEVFEPSFDCKEIFTKQFLLQKLNYIHTNPCRTNPPLAAHPTQYMHSSASYYYDNTLGAYAVDNIFEII
jgi:REP element-mobilizing transposase RayT